VLNQLRVAQQVAYRANFGYSVPMPALSKTLPVLVEQLAERELKGGSKP
jgi:hypothetical protein